jgi:glycosyltransferase involved in cell wall biosynthesis
LKFSIVTPSFRNSAWLRLCIASVADQEGVEHEHIVQDACSDDGTQDWLPHDPRVRAFIEKDGGMYDAVNRGFRRAEGDILAYLNCDEQYLPGGLRAVHEVFAQHPEVDVVLPDTVIVQADGSYLCHRYSMVPLRHHIWARFNVITSSLFLRRRVLDEHGLYFDTQWRDLGDVFWVIAAVECGARFAELRYFASAFTETGDNMNLKPNALREKVRKREMTPAWVKVVEPLIVGWHRWRMLRRGAFSQKPFTYALYTLKSPDRRVTMEARHPTALWQGRR